MSMNIDTAIVRIEDHMERHHIREYPHIYLGEALDMAIAALREKAEREDPKPLTLEELRQMDGEPVWMDAFEWRISYGVSTINGSLCLATGFDSWIPLDGYGETWFAYRHKPKEVTA